MERLKEQRKEEGRNRGEDEGMNRGEDEGMNRWEEEARNIGKDEGMNRWEDERMNRGEDEGMNRGEDDRNEWFNRRIDYLNVPDEDDEDHLEEAEVLWGEAARAEGPAPGAVPREID